MKFKSERKEGKDETHSDVDDDVFLVVLMYQLGILCERCLLFRSFVLVVSIRGSQNQVNCFYPRVMSSSAKQQE